LALDIGGIAFGTSTLRLSVASHNVGRLVGGAGMADAISIGNGYYTASVDEI
jgi:hypothetical protein